MKKVLLSIGLGSVLLLAACSPGTGDEKKTDTKATETAKAETKDTVVDGLKIKVKKQEVDEKVSDKKKQQLYTFTISGENMSSTNKGLGAVDFVLKTKDGKEIEVDPSMAMFGDEIKPGKTLEGKASFAVDEKQTATKLLYKPLDKVLAEWDVSK
ncbi:hypothetical protein X560_1499 [Listeria fleischmannii 1991]|jgi:uncharacterized protein affecting Mg2+/Co2+ transport|uniref:Telomeric repeat-binding factor 2 n=4 Tax=Listeria fleischmannii TaxID=1069827 RepID=A0A2X3GN76_9LIST|nr:DUF4352 domain-containing protein [Listeria fleischmannii]EIA19563.1 hypothetical protein KKC_11718 [Listeria fleischmannii subsp. coloradonensis]EMG26753.1 hypothetical protein LFLEISCH_14806 [Listeria fleischmannii subsp. fleischmannii LU2006-1]EUJ52725.1 hypothetical protein MCOL2_12579 [Listeria fleischmannii FSL S10-1203]KMT59945.1 hypothetical protein X560_1499 [Listeria fleischmannii 1991]MBC1398436.1 DUF4354 family protein [Listeria fleischmannii]